MDHEKDHIQNAPRHGEEFANEDIVDIEPDSSRNEEYAAEFTADEVSHRAETDGEVNTMYGWIGLALSIISFFMWPIVLGAAGVILGFVSRARGADALGNIAIVAGAVSILLSLFITPFF